MKTLNKVLLMGIIILFASCESFLEEDPKGKLSSKSFFSNENELNMAVHALYKQAMLYSQSNNRQVMYWASDDIGTHPASNKQIYREFDRFSVANDNSGVGLGWQDLFKVVKAANYIINNASKTLDTPQQKIDYAVGQACYWRAYAYFHLVRVWGPIPMMLEDDALDYNAQLVSVDKVYDQIVSDLKIAEGLPKSWTSTPQSINGMNVAVSEGAAKATLAYVYLTMGGWPLNQADKYALAASKAKEVIDAVDNGTYYYRLLDEYKQIHSWEYNFKNTELLIALYYNKDWGWEDNCMSSLCDILDEAGGWGDSCGEIGFWKAFPAGPRKDATYSPKTLRNTSDKALVDWWDAAGPAINPWFQKTAEGKNRAEWDYTKGGTETDWLGEKAHQVVRLSELYCWYAEAVGRSGGNDALAYTVLNRVRTRAGLSAIPSGSLTAGQLAEAAYDEHGWEIAGYYSGNLAPRLYDMQRMNRLKAHFEYRKANAPVEVAPGIFRKEAVPVEGNWNDDMMYAPYPAKDVLMNPNLKR